MLTPNTLFSFNGTNGADPAGELIADSAGNLIGTTETGGAYSSGTVFEITKTGGSYASTPTTRVSFNEANPAGGPIADSAGNLFGTTYDGGAYGSGTAFEITKTGGSYASTPTTLVNFYNAIGASPQAGLIEDSAGNLFGTTETGGTYDYGTVFEITYTDGSYASTPTTLVSFNNTNGANPAHGLIEDGAGNLFGTTGLGGANGDGTVFEITYTDGSYASTPTTLVSFNDTDGANPSSGLIEDGAGNLFGTTQGGGANGDGTVFEITYTDGSYASTPTTLVSFNGTNGVNPSDGLIEDSAGNLFGTTQGGGANGDRTVFEITYTDGSYASTPTTLVSFNGTNGATPQAGLIADSAGNLIGTTSFGGAHGDGTAFEITDSGFVPCFLAGTQIATPAGDVAVERLAVGERVRVLLGGGPTGDGFSEAIWVGRREVDCTRHPQPKKVWPVRVAAAAFGPGRPHSDLWLSPDHAVYVKEVLIPVKHLINGSTIVQVPVDHVTYHHIELANHDVLLAEGLPAESFLDAKVGSNYANRPGQTHLYPDFLVRMWEAFGCAPLIVTGAELEAARALVAGFAQVPEAA